MNIDFERRSKAAYAGWAMVTSIAHAWFNAYFEGGDRFGSGVFEADWEALDGIKGTTKKGVRALDRLKVVWRYPPPPPAKLGTGESPETESVGAALGKTVSQPGPGEPIPESRPADWRGEDSDVVERDTEYPSHDQENIPRRAEGKVDGTSDQHQTNDDTRSTDAKGKPVHTLERGLGMRKQEDESQDVSLANSDDDERIRDKHAKKTSHKPVDKDGYSDSEGTWPYFENSTGDG